MSQVASVQRLLRGDAVCYWAATMQDASGPELRHEVIVGVVTRVLGQGEESAIFVVRPGRAPGGCAAIKAAIPIGAETKFRVLAGAEDAAGELCEVRVGERSFVYEGLRADVETLAIAFNKANKAACDNGVTAAGRDHFQWVRAHMQDSDDGPSADEERGGGSGKGEVRVRALAPTDAACVERALRAEEREHSVHRTVS